MGPLVWYSFGMESTHRQEIVMSVAHLEAVIEELESDLAMRPSGHWVIEQELADAKAELFRRRDLPAIRSRAKAEGRNAVRVR